MFMHVNLYKERIIIIILYSVDDGYWWSSTEHQLVSHTAVLSKSVLCLWPYKTRSINTREVPTIHIISNNNQWLLALAYSLSIWFTSGEMRTICRLHHPLLPPYRSTEMSYYGVCIGSCIDVSKRWLDYAPWQEDYGIHSRLEKPKTRQLSNAVLHLSSPQQQSMACLCSVWFFKMISLHEISVCKLWLWSLNRQKVTI